VSRVGALAIAATLAIGCGHARMPAAFSAAYAHPSISRATRVMLVAGGDDVANFAAELTAQRKIWRGAGIEADQIACYWSKPSARAFAKDRRQYQRLVVGMQDCGPASPARVLADLAALADDPPPYLYLYVTGHGVPSLGASPTTWVLPPDERALLGTAALALDADPLLRVQHTDALLRAHRAGVPDRELVMTPATLRDALSRLPGSTRKIVVLQGCFSGAFVAGAGTLADLPNTVVLTAAAADRPSFGCGSGTRTTFWGGALGHELRDAVHRGDTPEKLQWHAIHEAVARRVTRLERALGQKPSRPQYLDTAR
jgi:Peptidase C13 family